MKDKLLKIAKYLGQNGFYKEAANLKKLATENTRPYSGTTLPLTNTNYWHTPSSGPLTDLSDEDREHQAYLRNPEDPDPDDPFLTDPQTNPDTDLPYFEDFTDWSLANKFFIWTENTNRVPNYHALSSYLNAHYDTFSATDGRPPPGFRRSDRWVQLPKSRWNGVRKKVEADPRFVRERPNLPPEKVDLPDLDPTSQRFDD